jgi:hypothetical protein
MYCLLGLLNNSVSKSVYTASVDGRLAIRNWKGFERTFLAQFEVKGPKRGQDTTFIFISLQGLKKFTQNSK